MVKIAEFFTRGYQAIVTALKPTRDKLKALFSRGINEQLAEELEQLFYEADLGVRTATELAVKTKAFLRGHPQATADEVIASIATELEALFPPQKPFQLTASPTVILIVGVNGNGKTTTIAKLAHHFQQQGKSVLLAAGDTFRAGAQEQLATWAQRLNVPLVGGTYKGDPAAVAFDALQAAKSRGIDVVLIDTAGRLENKTHLMRELEKVRTTCNKALPGAPHETLFILDATVGQNGLQHAKTFATFTPLTGIVLTKMDGTAKGGIAVAIQRECQTPILFMGTGEGIDDLALFDAHAYVQGLFQE